MFGEDGFLQEDDSDFASLDTCCEIGCPCNTDADCCNVYFCFSD
jgi:hypothetical protein